MPRSLVSDIPHQSLEEYPLIEGVVLPRASCLGLRVHRANIARADPYYVVSGCALRELTWLFLIIWFHADRLIGPDNAEVAGSIPASPTRRFDWNPGQADFIAATRVSVGDRRRPLRATQCGTNVALVLRLPR